VVLWIAEKVGAGEKATINRQFLEFYRRDSSHIFKVSEILFFWLTRVNHLTRDPIIILS